MNLLFDTIAPRVQKVRLDVKLLFHEPEDRFDQLYNKCVRQRNRR